MSLITVMRGRIHTYICTNMQPNATTSTQTCFKTALQWPILSSKHVKATSKFINHHMSAVRRSKMYSSRSHFQTPSTQKQESRFRSSIKVTLERGALPTQHTLPTSHGANTEQDLCKYIFTHARSTPFGNSGIEVSNAVEVWNV